MKLILKFFLPFFLIITIQGCNNFKRFEQKKFFCNANELKIDLIDILETRSIKKAYITVSNKEYPVAINTLTDSEINLQFDKINIIINIKNNKISAIKENKVIFLNCEESNFNI
tara:strand:- start:104 stop:445 length:342 start_codon:yes stop_codon:yes gene_type:complete